MFQLKITYRRTKSFYSLFIGGPNPFSPTSKGIFSIKNDWMIYYEGSSSLKLQTLLTSLIYDQSIDRSTSSIYPFPSPSVCILHWDMSLITLCTGLPACQQARHPPERWSCSTLQYEQTLSSVPVLPALSAISKHTHTRCSYFLSLYSQQHIHNILSEHSFWPFALSSYIDKVVPQAAQWVTCLWTMNNDSPGKISYVIWMERN